MSISFRRGVPGDLEDVRKLCTLGNGDDYVPHVWVGWTEDSSGQLEPCVALMDGSIVAVFCSFFAEYLFLKGLRVAANLRRTGIGAKVLDYVLSVAAQRNLPGVSFTTADDNISMRNLAEKMGYERPTAFLNHIAKVPSSTAPSSSALRVALASEFELVEKTLRESVDYQLGGGWYSDAFNAHPLTSELIQMHLAKGEVFLLDAAPSAVGICRLWERTHRGRLFWLSMLVGTQEHKEAFLEQLRIRFAGEEVRCQCVHSEENVSLLQRFHFHADSQWEGIYHLYIRKLVQ